jgi:signal transduction histidine kinase
MSLEVSAANDVVIEGDELALERVFANLLQNAFKFTPDGGHIALRLECRRADAIVSVHDDGPGIEPNKFSLLFEKFQHLESSERREGLGLGLHIVRELVAAHGGRVEVESVVGQGSCFSVYLPLTGRDHSFSRNGK